MKIGLPRQVVDAKAMGVLRAIGVAAAVFLPPYRWLFAETNIDPMWLRLVLSAMGLLLVLVSYLWRGIAQYALRITFAYAIILTLWMLSLVAVNGLQPPYIVSYFLMLFACLILFRDWTMIIGFIAIHIVGSVVAVLLIPPTALFDPIMFLALVGTTFALTTLGLATGFSELQLMNKREGQLRAINRASFDTTSEAILVTNRRGDVLHFNNVLIEMWQMQHLRVGQTSSSDWILAFQRLLVEPQLAIDVTNRAATNPEEPFSQLLELSDGRFVELLSRPVLEGAQLLGRVWFFRDVTERQFRQQAIEAAEARGRKHNEALIKLATEEANKSGDLHATLQRITRAVAQTVGAHRAGVWRLDGDKQILDCQCIHFSLTDHFDGGFAVTANESPKYFELLKTARVISIDNAYEDPLAKGFQLPYAVGKQRRSVLDVPLRAGGKLFGVLSAERDDSYEEWTPEDLQFLASVGDLVMVAVETDERHKAESQLANSVALLKAVFELAGVAILVTDLNHTVIDYNNTYLATWNMDTEFLLKNDADTVATYCRSFLQDPTSMLASFRFLIANPGENRSESLFFKDGRIVERFTEVLKVREEIIGRVWFYRDVTTRVRAEQKLVASEARNKAIVNAIPDLMGRIRPDGTILDLKIPDKSPFIAIAVAREVSELSDIFPTSFADTIISKAGMALSSNKVEEYETEVNLLGEIRDYEVRLAQSGPEELLVMVRDVTERKKTEKELMQRNHELDSFVYRASHDLKAPLNSLMGLIDILKAEGIDPQLLTYLSLMDKSVVKLDTFIRNLTDFSRIARMEIHNQLVHFEGLIGEVTEGLKYMKMGERVEKRIQIVPSAPFYGDEFHISIVLGNLISNAIKYHDMQKSNPYVAVDVSTTQEQCTIVVADNGLGIPKAHQGRIFDLFFRASNQSFGSGLGLYITRNAIDKMGGHIEMTSVEGMGSTFTVTLPNVAVKEKVAVRVSEESE